jgi:hypothetical protein
MVIYSFVPPFREATFFGVPSCVFDNLRCAAGEEILWNTDLGNMNARVYPSFSMFNETAVEILRIVRTNVSH